MPTGWQSLVSPCIVRREVSCVIYKVIFLFVQSFSNGCRNNAALSIICPPMQSVSGQNASICGCNASHSCSPKHRKQALARSSPAAMRSASARPSSGTPSISPDSFPAPAGKYSRLRSCPETVHYKNIRLAAHRVYLLQPEIRSPQMHCRSRFPLLQTELARLASPDQRSFPPTQRPLHH